MRPRLIAMGCAVAWAYAGAAAVVFHVPALIGPAVWGFVMSLFCAASLEEPFDEPVEEGADVGEGHETDGLFFASPRDGNR